MSEWLPMESAPQDGRFVRLLMANSLATVPVRGYWDSLVACWRVVGGPGPRPDLDFIGWQEIAA